MCPFDAHFTLKHREIRHMADMARQTVSEAKGRRRSGQNRGTNGRESSRRMTTLGSERQAQMEKRVPVGARFLV
jgi:hypothetical protein